MKNKMFAIALSVLFVLSTGASVVVSAAEASENIAPEVIQVEANSAQGQAAEGGSSSEVGQASSVSSAVSSAAASSFAVEESSVAGSTSASGTDSSQLDTTGASGSAVASSQSTSSEGTVASSSDAQVRPAVQQGVTFVAEDLAVPVDKPDFDLLTGVSASDEQGNAMVVSLGDTGGFDISVIGSYSVVYTVQHPVLGDVTATRKITVAKEMEIQSAPEKRSQLLAIVAAYLNDPEANPLPYWSAPVSETWVPTGFTQVKGTDPLTGKEYWVLEQSIAIAAFSLEGAVEVDTVSDLENLVQAATTDSTFLLTEAFVADYQLVGTMSLQLPDGVQIVIDGGNETLVNSATASRHINVTGLAGSKLVLQNVVLDSQGHNGGLGLSSGAYTIDTVTFTNIKPAFVSGVAYTAVSATDGNVTIQNSKFDTITNAYQAIATKSGSVTILGSSFKNTGMVLKPVDNTSTAGFVIENSQFDTLNGAVISAGNATPSIKIKGSTFTNIQAGVVSAVNANVDIETTEFTNITKGYAIGGGNQVTIHQSLIQNANFAGDNASAVSVGKSLKVTYSSFINSGAGPAWSGYAGGAIGGKGIDKTLIIENSYFEANAGPMYGGAVSMYQFGGTAVIKDSYFKNNSVGASNGKADGGAVGVFNNGQTLALTVDGVTFENNTARDDAGALFMESNKVGTPLVTTTVTNTTFVGNTANQYDNTGAGGAVQLSLNTTAKFINNTFYNNKIESLTSGSLGEGAAIGGHLSGQYPVVDLTNTLMVGNPGPATVTRNLYLNRNDKGGNIGFNATDENNGVLTVETVFGTNSPVLGANGSQIMAGKPGSAYEAIVPTLFIAPRLGDNAGIYADGFGVAGAGVPAKDQRGMAYAAGALDAGAVSIQWAKFDANGGQWANQGGYSYATPIRYSVDGTQAFVATNSQTVGAPMAPENGSLPLKGWSLVKDDPSTMVSTFATNEGADTYYAVWKLPETYTVNYLAGNATGTTPVDGNAYLEGENVTVLSADGIALAGHTFKGWRNSQDNRLYQRDEVFAITGNVTLTAEFEQVIFSSSSTSSSSSSASSSSSTSSSSASSSSNSTSSSSVPSSSGSVSSSSSQSNSVVPSSSSTASNTGASSVAPVSSSRPSSTSVSGARSIASGTNSVVINRIGASSQTSRTNASGGGAVTNSPSVSTSGTEEVTSNPVEKQSVENGRTPLFSREATQWALLNLILSVLTSLVSILLIVGLFRRSNNGEKHSYRVWVIVASILGALAPILFLLTETTTRKMVFVDVWTLPTLLIVAVQGILVAIAWKKRTEQDAQDIQE